MKKVMVAGGVVGCSMEEKGPDIMPGGLWETSAKDAGIVKIAEFAVKAEAVILQKLGNEGCAITSWTWKEAPAVSAQ